MLNFILTLKLKLPNWLPWNYADNTDVTVMSSRDRQQSLITLKRIELERR
jgi:hypothetical protein